MHDEQPIDMLIWPDSDEIFINEFPKYLVQFWDSKYLYMMLGFIEVFEDFTMILSQRMAPHGRVYKYNPDMTIHPWVGRTRYHPQCDVSRPWKLRHVVLHLCRFTKEYRSRRQFFDNGRDNDLLGRYLWKLPKDIREMTIDEIAEYQPGQHQCMPINKPTTVNEYLNNKKL
jgi:hypothetical protein